MSKNGSTADVISRYQDLHSFGREKQTFDVGILYENKENNWKVGHKLCVTINNRKMSNELFVDLSFYNENRSKLFSIEGCKLKPALKLKDCLKYEIINPGIVNTNIYIDIGVKQHSLDSYMYMERNVAEIRTDRTSTSNPVSGIIIPSFLIINE